MSRGRPGTGAGGRLAPADLERFRAGTHAGLHRLLGANPEGEGTEAGLRFAVWVPEAAAVQVTGDFCSWDPTACHLERRPDGSGVWEGFVRGARVGMRYRYRVTAPDGTVLPEEIDPLAFADVGPGGACSIAGRPEPPPPRPGGVGEAGPVSIYQVHLDSWRRVPEEMNRPLAYGEVAAWLPGHLRETGFTHVELVQTPADQVPSVAGLGRSSFFAPPGGQGDAAGFAALVAALHGAGVGVLLRRSVAASDAGRLLGRPEARSILLSAAAAWLEIYGLEGLRLEIPDGESDDDSGAVAEGFVRDLGRALPAGRGPLLVFGGPSDAPHRAPAESGRVLLWRAEWEARVRSYFALDPIHRSRHHDAIVQAVEAARAPGALLPLSCGGGPPDGTTLLGAMWGDERQRLAHLRLLLGLAWLCPGAKLLFMGGEFGQWGPWRRGGSLDWHLLGEERHRQVLRWVAHLNIFLRGEPALRDAAGAGESFSWVDAGDREQSVLCFLRGAGSQARLLVVCNFTPVPRTNYRVGVPRGGFWAEVLNADAGEYGGWGMGNVGGAEAAPVPFHGRRHSLSLVLPPLAVVVFRSAAG